MEGSSLLDHRRFYPNSPVPNTACTHKTSWNKRFAKANLQMHMCIKTQRVAPAEITECPTQPAHAQNDRNVAFKQICNCTCMYTNIGSHPCGDHAVSNTACTLTERHKRNIKADLQLHMHVSKHRESPMRRSGSVKHSLHTRKLS
jgi:hypothetical protein